MSADKDYTYLPYLRIFEPKTEGMYLSSAGAIKKPKIWKIRSFHTVRI